MKKELTKEEVEQIKLYNKQIRLLVVAIAVSFFSIYSINKSKRETIFGEDENFDANKNSVIITIITFITIIFYWDIAYKRYIKVINDKYSTMKEIETVKMNLGARTLILLAVIIDLFLVINTYLDGIGDKNKKESK